MRIALLFTAALLLAGVPVCSQLCTGSLGDPVVHISFGGGGTQGNPAASATTTYSFLSGDCPNDGSYTIRSATSACFGNTWHTVTEDHTPGDVNGYMMVVNASFQPGDFFVDTVRGLCANTTYELAAWVLNVLRTSACGGNGIDPNLTFRIETTTGAVLATYNSGNITETFNPNWQQYGVFFTTTASSTSVVLRITNNAPGGCGNDILLDDITFRPCGPLVNAALSITGDTTAEVCEGNPATFLLQSAASTGYNDPVYQWQVSFNGGTFQDITGATDQQYLRQPTDSGIYRYRLSMAESVNAVYTNCRVASNMVTISVNGLPSPGLSDTTTGCAETNLLLEASGGEIYNWTGPNGFTATGKNVTVPGLQAADAGLYRVLVTTIKGCSDGDSTEVVVHPAVDPLVAGGASVCEGVPVNLLASGGVRYEWAPASGLSSATIPNPVASPTDSTIYKVTVFSEYGCFDTASVAVNIWKKPVANAGPNKQILEGQSVSLEGMAEGTQVIYFWTPPNTLNDGSSLSPVARPVDNTTYTLHVVSQLGCGTSTDDVFVRVFKQVKIPNAFSPNGDGINDEWKIINLITYPEATLQVFNRHGQKVFESRGYARNWNGTYNGQPLPVGTYYYVIDLKTEFFSRLSGWVFIAR
jgi:gliding motility-associated-like protein